MPFCRLLILFRVNFSKISFRNTTRVSNGLDPDQALHFDRPDLGPNCLQGLSADDTSRQRIKDDYDTYIKIDDKFRTNGHRALIFFTGVYLFGRVFQIYQNIS